MNLDLRVNGSTILTGLIGNPVEHTVSPVLQNSLFSATGTNGIYLPLKVPEGCLKDAVNGLKSVGFSGFNVTIPYKGAIVEYLDEISGEAELLEAVNTVKLEGDRLIGYNTDADGFLRAFSEQTNTGFAQKTVCILGAGGTARTLAIKIALEGADKICIINRTLSNARMLAEKINQVMSRRGHIKKTDTSYTPTATETEAAPTAGAESTATAPIATAPMATAPTPTPTAPTPTAAAPTPTPATPTNTAPVAAPTATAAAAGSPESALALEQCDIIINATSVGMHPNTDFCPLGERSSFRQEQIIYDVIYNPIETKLMALARRSGCIVANGAGMLFYQGVKAFEIWMGPIIPAKRLEEISNVFLKYLLR